MTGKDRGAGAFKAIIALLFLAAVIFCGIKIIPVYVNNYELSDFVNGLAVDATVASPRPTVQGVQDQVLQKAQELGLPVTRENVKATVGPTVTISVDYTVPIDLKAFTFPMHFSHSATNSRLY